MEWPGTPLFTFQPAVVGPERIVRVYGVRTGTQLDFAYLINGNNVKEASDAARLYIDTTNNGPWPLTRPIGCSRSTATAIRWSGRALAAISMDRVGMRPTPPPIGRRPGEPGSGQWVVEMSINIAAELGTLADPFGLMAEVFYSGDTSAYPSAASSSQANTWQDIGNPACP